MGVEYSEGAKFFFLNPKYVEDNPKFYGEILTSSSKIIDGGGPPHESPIYGGSSS